MNRKQRRSRSSGAGQVRHVDLAAENAQLRRELNDARQQLAEWRGLLVENDLIEPTPSEHLWYMLMGFDWPPMKLDRVGWVGGCEHAWSAALCHVLNAAEIEELRRREGEGLDLGGDASDITETTDPRCGVCQREPRWSQERAS